LQAVGCFSAVVAPQGDDTCEDGSASGSARGNPTSRHWAPSLPPSSLPNGKRREEGRRRC